MLSYVKSDQAYNRITYKTYALEVDFLSRFEFFIVYCLCIYYRRHLASLLRYLRYVNSRLSVNEIRTMHALQLNLFLLAFARKPYHRQQH